MPATRNEQTVARSLTVRVQVSIRSACVSVLLLSSGAAAFSARPHSVHLGLHRVASTDRLPLPSTRFLRQISDQPAYGQLNMAHQRGGGMLALKSEKELSDEVDKATSEAWEQSGGLGTVTALWEIASWELAKRTRVLISLIAAFTLIYRHDALAIMTLAGAIANALLGKVLKRIIKEERPPGAPVSDPGMPSSHANSIFFFFSFLAGAILFWVEGWSAAARGGAVAGLCVLSTSAAHWRVRAGFHTPEQVLAGAALGSCSGTAWFAVLSEMGSALEALDTWLGQDARLPFVLFVFVVGGAAVVESVERRFPRLLDRATAKFAEARQQLEARRD